MAEGVPRTLFDRLRAWRLEVSRARNVPAYVIFQDGVLQEIARQRPGDLARLGAISGVGDRKLEAYGTALLALIEASEVG